MDKNRFDLLTRTKIQAEAVAEAVRLGVYGRRELCNTEQRARIARCGVESVGYKMSKLNDRELDWLDEIVDSVLSPF